MKASLPFIFWGTAMYPLISEASPFLLEPNTSDDAQKTELRPEEDNEVQGKCYEAFIQAIEKAFSESMASDSDMEMPNAPESHEHLVARAEWFLTTCPGSWNTSFTLPLQSILIRIVGGHPVEGYLDSVQTMDFWWSMADFADRLVREFGLPVPLNTKCIMWDSYEWRRKMTRTWPDFEEERESIWHQIVHSEPKIRPVATRAQSERGFPRFSSYLIAAVYEARLEQTEMIAKIKEIGAFVDEIRNRESKKLFEAALADAKVRERAREFFESIGRKTRDVSLE